MSDLVALYEPDPEWHVILDNLSTHKPQRDRWRACHPRVHFHYTPTPASWLNQIESWCSKLSRAARQGASFACVRELRRPQALADFLAAHNRTAQPCEGRKADVRPQPLQSKYADLRN